MVLEHHECPQELIKQMMSQCGAYLSSDSEAEFVSLAKSLTTVPLSDYLKNPRPKAPLKGYFEFTGAARRWWRSRLHALCSKNSHFFYSWLQTKRCCLPLTEEMVDAALRKHAESLSRDDPLTLDNLHRFVTNSTFRYLCKRIRRNVAKQYNHDHGFYAPSTSSHFGSNRSQGGALGHIRRVLDEHVAGMRRSDVERHSFMCGKQLLRMSWSPYRLFEGRREANVHMTEYTDWGVEYWDKLRDIMKPLSTFEGELLRRDLLRTLRSGAEVVKAASKLPFDITSRELPLDRCLVAVVQCVLEPLKTRLISCGESFDYYFAKNIQKALWGALQGMPCFELTGKKFDASMVMDCASGLFEAGGTQEGNPNGWGWVSVDYSSATDFLSSRFGKWILGDLIMDLPEEVRINAMRVLGLHDLYYPTKEGPEFRAHQTNGQLMGSPVSFPILCLANIATFLTVVDETPGMCEAYLGQGPRAERTKDQHESLLRRVKVNGDDMLYVGPQGSLEKHASVAASVGLEMSVGKAYFHSVYGNVNSTSFHCHLDKKRLQPRTIDYFRAGLVLGLHKVQSDARDDLDRSSTVERIAKGVSDYQLKRLLAERRKADPSDFEPLSAVLNEIIGACWGPKATIKTVAMFLRLHKKVILAETLAVATVYRKRSKEEVDVQDETFFKHHGLKPESVYRDRLRNYRQEMNSTITEKMSFHRNLFLPKSRGGMGVVKPEGFRCNISGLQRRVAYALSQQMEQPSLRIGPLPEGRKRGHAEDPTPQPWSTMPLSKVGVVNDDIPVFNATLDKRLYYPVFLDLVPTFSNGHKELVAIDPPYTYNTSSPSVYESIDVDKLVADGEQFMRIEKFFAELRRSAQESFEHNKDHLRDLGIERATIAA